MAEIFIFPIAQQLLAKLSSPVVQEISLTWGVKDDLRRLKNTVSCVQAVLLDAQERQASSHQLKNWLEKLEDALYRSQDLIEEFEIGASRYKTCDSTMIRKIRRGFSSSNKIVFRFKMARKMKNIRERFDEIAANRTSFNLIERSDERVVVHREMTHSFVRDEDVIGRDDEKEVVIKFLLATDDKSLSVVPIIGLGGMGKTILAKLVYNDERVVNHFDLRIWVCIPEEFELKRAIEKILKCAGVIDRDNLPLEQLQKDLREKLENVKYLLILDDVWNENHSKWIDLRNLLIGGAKGSKIIVTTRNESVASIMATTNLNVEVKGLSYEESLSLFLKWAFKSSQDVIRYPQLLEIAGSIVKKCKGVPLAVRTLGSILYTKTDVGEWINMRDSDIWKMEQKEGDILPSLKLSYYQLPTNLRRCFAFCSIFPKDYQFYNILLTSYWHAAGLLQQIGDSRDVDDVGMMYIKQLQSRGFFQDFENYGGFVRFKMHDFVHDLALLVAGRDCVNMSSLEGPSLKNKSSLEVRDCFTPGIVRHISFPNDYFSKDEMPSWLLKQKENVHSLVFPNGVGASKASFIDTYISKFKSLRLLDLFKSSFEVLPSSFSSLKNLKRLDLSHNLQLKALPASICELVGLEALHFTGCLNLERLPRGLGKLILLRSLAVSTKEFCLPDNEIRCLRSLKHLVITCCPNMKYILSDDAMQSLSTLRSIYIRKCRSLVSLPVRGLRHLPLLESLNISICRHLEFTIDSDNCETENIGGEGLRSLHSLNVGSVPKLEILPLWLLRDTKNLKYIGISECDNLTSLMSEQVLKSLISLQKLRINSCSKLKSLPKQMCSLTALNEVQILECPELVSRCQRDIGEDWDKICHVPNIYIDDIKI